MGKAKMNYDLLYVNGDSYTQPDIEKPVYPNYIANYLNIDLINSAIQGSNNTRILRSSLIEISDLLSMKKTPLVIIGLSFIRRQEVWEEINFLHNINNFKNDNRDYPFKNRGELYGPITLDKAIDIPSISRKEYFKMMISQEDYDMPQLIINFYMLLYFFTNWLEKNNLKYFIFSAADNKNESTEYYNYMNEINFIKEVQNNQYISNIHGFNFLDWSREFDEYAENTGHLSTTGHQDMSKYLLELLIDKNII